MAAAEEEVLGLSAIEAKKLAVGVHKHNARRIHYVIEFNRCTHLVTNENAGTLMVDYVGECGNMFRQEKCFRDNVDALHGYLQPYPFSDRLHDKDTMMSHSKSTFRNAYQKWILNPPPAPEPRTEPTPEPRTEPTPEPRTESMQWKASPPPPKQASPPPVPPEENDFEENDSEPPRNDSVQASPPPVPSEENDFVELFEQKCKVEEEPEETIKRLKERIKRLEEELNVTKAHLKFYMDQNQS